MCLCESVCMHECECCVSVYVCVCKRERGSVCVLCVRVSLCVHVSLCAGEAEEDRSPRFTQQSTGVFQAKRSV